MRADTRVASRVGMLDKLPCCFCGRHRPLLAFYLVARRGIPTYTTDCRECHKYRVATGGMVRRRKLRNEALDAYGGKCACCGESRRIFLVIDHVDGGGNTHRKSIGNGSHLTAGEATYRWLKKRGWPDGYQVLCANCNMAKERGGCPCRLAI